MTWENLDGYIGWAVAVLGGIGTLWLIARSVAKRIRGAWGKFDAAVDALVGRAEIKHPDTGEVLAEATPSLGVRLAKMDQNMEAMQLAIVHLAESNANIARLHERVDDLDKRLMAHIEDCKKPLPKIGFTVEAKPE